MRAEHVDAAARAPARPGVADVGNAGAVIDRRMAAARQCARATASRSSRSTDVHCTAASPMPGRGPPRTCDQAATRRLAFEEMIDEVAAGEAGRAGDQRRHQARRRSGPRRAVLRVVVGAERRILVLDRPPPPFVLPGTRPRSRAGRLERDLRRASRAPAASTYRASSGGRGRDDPPRGGIRASGRPSELQDPMRQIDVPDVIAAADVVDLAGRARSISRSTARQ